MSFLRGLAGLGTLGLSESLYFQPKDRRRELDGYTAQQNQMREANKRRQYALLGEMKRPGLSEAAERRIKALEMESDTSKPLVEDALFQGDRAQIVQGGQQALSSVQNTQRAHGTSGGFANQGSVADVYDRLGSQLADLGQKSRHVKEQKRDTAAQARQDAMDAQIEFDNAQTQAKMAIEQGDYEAFSAALAQAQAARDRISQAQTQAFGAVLGAGAQVAGYAMGGPAGGGAAKAATSGMSGGGGFDTSSIQGPSVDDLEMFRPRRPVTWSSMRKRV
jgi:hypothetical protein